MFLKKGYFLILAISFALLGAEVEALKIESANKATSREENSKNRVNKKDEVSIIQTIYSIQQEKLLSGTALHKEMMDQVQELQVKFNKEAIELTREFEEKKSEYEKAATATKEALSPLEEKLRMIMQKMNEMETSYKDLFQSIEKTYIERIFAEVEKATKLFLEKEENKNAIIVATGPGIFVHKRFDITEEIIAVINSSVSKSEAKAEKKNQLRKKLKKQRKNKK